jgi:hypothetical protein
MSKKENDLLPLAVIAGFALWYFGIREAKGATPVAPPLPQQWWLDPSSPTPLPLELWQRSFIAEWDKPNTAVSQYLRELEKVKAQPQEAEAFFKAISPTRNTPEQNKAWFLWAMNQMIRVRIPA